MKAIRGGTVYTMAGPPIENGTVLISNGKITAVGGPELPVPAEAQCIDAADLPPLPTGLHWFRRGQ